jgi:hypothetical protein
MMANRFPFGPARRSDGDAERPVDVFVRGLLSGAFVGAVIAGSAVWERRRRRASSSPVGAGKTSVSDSRGESSQSEES